MEDVLDLIDALLNRRSLFLTVKKHKRVNEVYHMFSLIFFFILFSHEYFLPFFTFLEHDFYDQRLIVLGLFWGHSNQLLLIIFFPLD